MTALVLIRRAALAVALLLATLLTPAAAHAQAGIFSRMGFGARGVSMGNALVADASGLSSPYYNPALAVFTTRQNIEASAALLNQGRELQFLQLSAPLPPRAGAAVGLIHAAVTGIDGRDGSGFSTGELRTDEFAFFVAFGLRMSGRLSGGLGLQVFRNQLHPDLRPSLAIGVDAGLVYEVTDALHLGLALDDLLARYTYDTSRIYSEGGKSTTDNFPVRLRLGARYTRGPLALNAEFEQRLSQRQFVERTTELRGGQIVLASTSTGFTDAAQRVRLGTEYRLAEAFSLRGGLDGIGADGVGAALRPSLGFGIEQEAGPLVLRGSYGFALQPYGTGGMHLVTLQVLL